MSHSTVTDLFGAFGFEEPELNSYHISVDVTDIKKKDALKIAEAIRSILDHEDHEGARVLVSHVKFDG